MKIIARLLYRLKRSGIHFRLAAWHCGTAENFNPMDGAVTLTADAPQEQVNALLATLLWLMPNNLYHETESEALTINNIGLLSLESGVFHAAASCRSKLGSCEE